MDSHGDLLTRLKLTLLHAYQRDTITVNDPIIICEIMESKREHALLLDVGFVDASKGPSDNRSTT